MSVKLASLTASQQRIADELADAHLEDRPVFVSGLVKKFDYAGESSITPILKILERKGMVSVATVGANKGTRVIRLTSIGKRVMRVGGLPVLGEIPAGPLAEAIESSDEFIEIGNLLKVQPDDFLLRVKGDSMIDAGIFNNDLAQIRPNVEVQQGQIAAVYSGDDYSSTLKKVYFEPNHVRLKACNENYEDILIPFHKWRGIAGVYKGLVRNATT